MCSDKILNVVWSYGVKPWGGNVEANKRTIYLKTEIITRTMQTTLGESASRG
jgi:hypothetical protein